ncbi:hypothetical protein GCM10010937_10010 [Gluconobacter japonicus]|uniref:Uncharacterized protein n=1 Tax=Gluconobacter japonicus TaxID=376620 RepID=A0ABQ5WHM5_GLUJA|nr:hypothetical protein AA3271_2168 [Gluconobacter japonicus NBRC 3271]GLQ59198.1 hypothetical protein GCM10010937_10010 [Gluconobacter japonicus]
MKAVAPSGSLLPSVIQKQFFQSGIKAFESRRAGEWLIRATSLAEVSQNGFWRFLELAPHPFQNTGGNTVWKVVGSREAGKSVEKDKTFAPRKILTQQGKAAC